MGLYQSESESDTWCGIFPYTLHVELPFVYLNIKGEKRKLRLNSVKPLKLRQLKLDEENKRAKNLKRP